MASLPSVIGRYEILQKIGQGGMGSLYLARDPRIDRQVAVKVLRDELDNDEVRHRFSQEARAAGQLQHQGIVTIFDFGEHEGWPFIAMEYVRGETLASLIQRKADVSLRRKLEWMDALFGGLHYAHRAGVIHRDVKPANIMIADDGILKILDFGIARFGVSDQTQTGMMMGTPHYISPEQIRGERTVDARADQFSAGLVFYELMYYQRAFAGTGFDVIHRVLTEIPEWPSVPDVPVAVRSVIARCIEKDPKARFPDLGAARTALAAARRQIDDEADDETRLVYPSASDAATPAKTQPDAETALSPPTPRTEVVVRHAKSVLPSVPGPPPIPESQRQIPQSPAATSLDLSLVDAATILLPRAMPRPGKPAGTDSTPIHVDGDTRQFGVDRTLVLPAAEESPRTNDLSDIKLVVIDAANPRAIGRMFPLVGTSVTLGREGDWLSVADSGWSRQHAEIHCTPGGFMVRDLGTVNGTRVNGRPVPAGTGQSLLFGSRIAIGSTVFTFSYAHDTTLPDLTGAEVDGRYILETRLRDGAKAVLYAARDKRLPGRVALKLLSPELATYPEYLERFRLEAEMARQLHHPHICRVLDYGQSTVKRTGFREISTHFLCIDLMEGGNLADRLDRKEVLPTQQVATWIRLVADALGYAHRNKLVHGDLKPTAIVFDNEDNPYVTDFAVAQKASQDRPYVVGTPAFMAPELWQSEAPSPAVDQFALAALSYFMITGSRPFEGQDHPEIRRRNFAQGPLPAHQEAEHQGRPGVLRGVSSVLARGLATRAQDRYPSIADFAGALSAALVRPARAPDAPQLFFSYQRESMAGWVNYFADRVGGLGLSVFVDTHNRDGSGVFPEQLSRAIEDCLVFVCFVGDKTLESKWVRDEIGLAHQYGKPMVPVFQENYVRPPDDALTPGITRLLTSTGVHLQDRRNLSPERSVADLVALVKRNIDREKPG